MGQPLATTTPDLKNLPNRFCAEREERRAAELGKSLLRLGVCAPGDWQGSAVDLVERGFKRFCAGHGVADCARVWQGELRIADQVFELSEYELQQADTELNRPPRILYVVGEFTAAASIPIGPAWLRVEREDPRFPAALYRVLTENLAKWMRVYDYRDGLFHAELWMEGLDEQEIRDSLYFKLRQNLPPRLREAERFDYEDARLFLEMLVGKLRDQQMRELTVNVLTMHECGMGHEAAWPEKSAEQVPEIEDLLSESDGCGPGCLLCWEEGDEINGCFDEEMNAIGQNGPLAPSLLMVLRLDQKEKALDRELKRVFHHLAAMLRSLAAAARAVEIIREINDEYLREHRLQPGLQVEHGPAGVWQEQL